MIGESTSSVLCPALLSPLQERRGHSRANPLKGNGDNAGAGASLVQGFLFFLFLQSKGDWTLKQVDLLSGCDVSIWVDA